MADCNAECCVIVTKEHEQNMNSDFLFYVSRANIFEIYPEILKELLVLEELKNQNVAVVNAFGHILSPIHLPSDFEWQLKQYYRLLEVQKKINKAVEKGV